MSYDVTLHPSADFTVEQEELYWRNHTSNTAPMWRAAGVDIAEFHGKCAREMEQPLSSALAAMVADPDRFRAMDAPNRWGTYETTYDFLADLHGACCNYPAAFVHVSR